MVEPWRGELRRGLERLRNGEFDAAESHFARAHRLAPDRAEVCFAFGRERLRRGDLIEAEALLTQAWKLDTSLMSAAAFLARCIGLDRREFARAHLVLADAYQRHGRAAPLCMVEAELLLEEGRTAEAQAVADEVLAQPDAPDGARDAARALLARVFNLEGLARAGRGEMEAALFAFRRAGDLDSDWSAPVANLGAAFESIGRIDKARAAYERALAIEPDGATPRFNLARLLRDRGDARAALALLERPRSSGTAAPAQDAPELVALRAELYIAGGQHERATEILAEAVARAPELPGAWVDLAAGWLAAGDRTRAEECLRIALGLAPDHGAAKVRLAAIMAGDGREVEAALLVDGGFAVDPWAGPRLHTGKR
ncbi:MAG TPA: tetratricopeptide repeat protein [Kofleriaceae bacterium]|nr:tetratricopeptide repeat protein [Kofleriaceae bacterium]